MRGIRHAQLGRIAIKKSGPQELYVWSKWTMIIGDGVGVGRGRGGGAPQNTYIHYCDWWTALHVEGIGEWHARDQKLFICQMSCMCGPGWGAGARKLWARGCGRTGPLLGQDAGGVEAQLDGCLQAAACRSRCQECLRRVPCC